MIISIAESDKHFKMFSETNVAEIANGPSRLFYALDLNPTHVLKHIDYKLQSANQASEDVACTL